MLHYKQSRITRHVSMQSIKLIYFTSLNVKAEAWLGFFHGSHIPANSQKHFKSKIQLNSRWRAHVLTILHILR